MEGIGETFQIRGTDPSRRQWECDHSRTSPLLVIDRVTKSYDGQRKAVDALSLQVNQGEIVGLIGPNGAGKTTTVMMVAGLLRPDSGRVIIGGVDLAKDPLHAKRFLGIVPDTTDTVDNLTGWEYAYLTAALYNLSGEAVRKRIAALFELFSMAPFQHQLIGTYSHGMVRKVQLTAALAHQPQVLILDEPTASLDAESCLLFKGLLKQLKSRGAAVLLATHQMALAEEMCDRICLLRQGRRIAWDQPERLLMAHQAASLEEVFIKLAVDQGAMERALDAVVGHL